VSTRALTNTSGAARLIAATFAACACGATSASPVLSSTLIPATPSAAT
jgi:hypothetical protein